MNAVIIIITIKYTLDIVIRTHLVQIRGKYSREISIILLPYNNNFELTHKMLVTTLAF